MNDVHKKVRTLKYLNMNETYTDIQFIIIFSNLVCLKINPRWTTVSIPHNISCSSCVKKLFGEQLKMSLLINSMTALFFFQDKGSRNGSEQFNCMGPLQSVHPSSLSKHHLIVDYDCQRSFEKLVISWKCLVKTNFWTRQLCGGGVEGWYMYGTGMMIQTYVLLTLMNTWSELTHFSSW